jgi:hypothetical protein
LALAFLALALAAASAWSWSWLINEQRKIADMNVSTLFYIIFQPLPGDSSQDRYSFKAFKL